MPTEGLEVETIANLIVNFNAMKLQTFCLSSEIFSAAHVLWDSRNVNIAC